MPFGGERTATAKPFSCQSGSVRNKKLPPMRRIEPSFAISTMPLPPGSIIKAARVCGSGVEHSLNTNLGAWQISDKGLGGWSGSRQYEKHSEQEDEEPPAQSGWVVIHRGF